MARIAKSKATPEEQLAKVVAQIEKTEAELKALKKQKIQLEKDVKASQVEELSGIIAESGMSIEDIKKLLTDKQKKSSK